MVDGASSLCLGCYRTLSEIAGWSGLTDEERAAIMAELPEREGGSRARARDRDEALGWRRQVPALSLEPDLSP